MTSTKERVTPILCDLIALPTVNPMGRPYRGPAIERSVVEYLEELFSPYAVAMRRMACSEIHESQRLARSHGTFSSRAVGIWRRAASIDLVAGRRR